MRLDRSATGAIPESITAMPTPMPRASSGVRPSTARSWFVVPDGSPVVVAVGASGAE